MEAHIIRNQLALCGRASRRRVHAEQETEEGSTHRSNRPIFRRRTRLGTGRLAMVLVFGMRRFQMYDQ